MLQVNHLIGFGGAQAGPDPVTALSLVASGTSTAANGAVTVSATINAGDLIVCHGQSSGLTSTSFPSGFTQILAPVNITSAKNGLFYKIATGTEGTSITGFVGVGIGANAVNNVYVFRANVPITTATPTDPESAVSDGNPGSLTVNASGGVVPLVVVAGYLSSGAIDPRTFTVAGSPAKDGEINASTGAYLAYKIYNSSPADVVIDMDDEGSANTVMSCYIACA